METDGAPIPVWIEFESVADDFTGDLPALSVSRIDGVRRKHDLRGTNPDDDGFRSGRWQRVRAGDLLVNRMQAWRGAAGVAWEDGITSSHYLVFRPRGTRFDLRFLDYLVRSSPIVALFDSRSIGIRNDQYELSRSRFAELRISAPALEEQRRIADMLDIETARIDTLIRKNDQVAGLLAARAARVLEDEIFSANARPVGIHYLATYVNGFPFKPEDRSDEGTPIVRIAQLLGDTREQDFYDGTPDAYCHIDSGDLIFSWSATLAAKIWEGGPAFLNQHLFKVEPHEHVDRDWLLHALNATVPRMKALTHGSTMTHITRPMMTKIRVPKPSLPEQRSIAERIAVQFALLGALRAKIDRQQELLRERRQSLITAAVTGQIEV